MEAYSHDNDCIAFPSVFVNVQQHLAGGYHCTGVPAANHFQTQTLIFVPCFATWRNVLTLLQIMYPAWATVRRIALFFFYFVSEEGMVFCIARASGSGRYMYRRKPLLEYGEE
jgi:hypothetical protein